MTASIPAHAQASSGREVGRSRPAEMSGTERKSVLFFTPFGEWQVHNQLDVTIAAALEARGVGIYYLTCDGAYQPCAITRGQQDCVRCQAVMAATLASQSVGSSPFRKFMTQGDVARADAWVEALPNEGLATARFDDLPVGEWALSSVMTQFRISSSRSELPGDADDHRARRRNRLRPLGGRPRSRIRLRDSIGFHWAGCEEGDEVEGEGTAELLDDGTIEIEFAYRNGDEAVPKAKRDPSSTAC